MSRFYSFLVNDFKKQPFDLKTLQGKVVLIVNVASLCGATPQYKGLETLYQKYKEKGFVILGFPTNDFFQEPTDAIATTCQRNYGVTFPIMERVHVNGASEHEIYKWLKSEKSGMFGFKSVAWNFEKFLLDREGQLVDRFLTSVQPEEIEAHIVQQLEK
ncbi:hypothetical protein HDU96_002277 [Phlyctochytrium bullatum]|nr:hypothetical protein HDU96_002277 [Phlyctochytrium bullatum]